MDKKVPTESIRVTLLWGAFLILLFYAGKLLLRMFLPFLLGFTLAWLLRPAVNGISRFSGAKKSFWSVALLLLLYFVIALVLWGAISFLMSGLQMLFDRLPSFTEDYLQPMARSVEEHLPFLIAEGPSGKWIEQVVNALMQLSGKALSAISGWIAKAPSVFTAFLFMILSSFFISLDYPAITRWVMAHLPQQAARLLSDLRTFLSDTLLRMARAYLLLMGITFLLSSVGLWMLRVRHPIVTAAVIGLMDLLPVLGPGIIFLPWALAALIQNEVYMAVGLLAVYGVICTVRTAVEPKILGKQLGIHPLATITVMYAGGSVGGLGGFLLAPVLFLYLRHLYRQKNVDASGGKWFWDLLS